ncbi:hypothetical protein HY995_06005 [Candidatus Micrarchaeota archaeon]|nr:hypothetical protein [Candidatus Micrarchaeota archaeon]MBI5177607.1 hypothetical protein [Candidatus Micrarchaeota archaeon]
MVQTRDILVLLAVFAAGTAVGLWLQSSPASPIAGAAIAGTAIGGRRQAALQLRPAGN